MTLTAVAVAAAFLSVPAKADPQAEPRAAMTELSHELVALPVPPISTTTHWLSRKPARPAARSIRR